MTPSRVSKGVGDVLWWIAMALVFGASIFLMLRGLDCLAGQCPSRCRCDAQIGATEMNISQLETIRKTFDESVDWSKTMTSAEAFQAIMKRKKELYLNNVTKFPPHLDPTIGMLDSLFRVIEAGPRGEE